MSQTAKTGRSKAPFIIIACALVTTSLAAITVVSSNKGGELGSGDTDRVMAALGQIDNEELKSDRMKDLRAKAFATLREAPLEATFGALNDDSLTEEQRRQLEENLGELMREDMDRKVEEYFDASAETQEEILDRHIDDWTEFRRKMREYRDKQRAENGDKDEESRRDRWRNRPPPSIEDRKKRMEGRNPDSDMRRIKYFMAMRQRAQDRGVDFGRGRRGGGGGGRGGRGGGPRR